MKNKLGPDMKIYGKHFETAWGNAFLTATTGGLFSFFLPPFGQKENFEPQALEGAGEALSYLEKGIESLQRFFAGERVRFSLPLDEAGLTPFRAKVYRALATVPWGQTVSYASLASMAGLPGAARAVGGAMAANRLPVIIP